MAKSSVPASPLFPKNSCPLKSSRAPGPGMPRCFQPPAPGLAHWEKFLRPPPRPELLEDMGTEYPPPRKGRVPGAEGAVLESGAGAIERERVTYLDGGVELRISGSLDARLRHGK